MQFSKLKWINQQPYSLDFDDIYYSLDNGLAETDHVFIQHNQLTERFKQLESTSFTIIETGFGTGLNFFCAAQHFLAHAPENASLQFISTERFPLTLEDFIKANRHWRVFDQMVKQLTSSYTQLSKGLNELNCCSGRIKLDLWIGDVSDTLPQILTPADAWFLDGFAPSKNDDMWSETLFQEIARLSQTNTTFATFTSAGQVRRNLQAIGYDVKKVTGFGRKREMLCGVFP
ncbi:MAG: tRNA (5-methylaminomethyl-2-thiouridine)(34)-methyltransferase MnmD [Methylophilaceae bacterium]|jgi:tRNA 5-methylaminomethyl-2-thiouridine biosynthesis bifunctional protein